MPPAPPSPTVVDAVRKILDRRVELVRQLHGAIQLLPENSERGTSMRALQATREHLVSRVVALAPDMPGQVWDDAADQPFDTTRTVASYLRDKLNKEKAMSDAALAVRRPAEEAFRHIRGLAYQIGLDAVDQPWGIWNARPRRAQAKEAVAQIKEAVDEARELLSPPAELPSQWQATDVRNPEDRAELPPVERAQAEVIAAFNELDELLNDFETNEPSSLRDVEQRLWRLIPQDSVTHDERREDGIEAPTAIGDVLDPMAIIDIDHEVDITSALLDQAETYTRQLVDKTAYLSSLVLTTRPIAIALDTLERQFWTAVGRPEVHQATIPAVGSDDELSWLSRYDAGDLNSLTRQPGIYTDAELREIVEFAQHNGAFPTHESPWFSGTVNTPAAGRQSPGGKAF